MLSQRFTCSLSLTVSRQVSPRLTVWASRIDCNYADCMGFDRTYPLDLDIGELADGHHLIVRSISLRNESLIVDWAFVPEPAEGARLWPEIRYDADVSPPGWGGWRADWDQFARPVPKARKVWFDFVRPDYDWIVHVDWGGSGQPDDDYLRNRVARLNLHLETGAARIVR